jgi:UDP-glucose 4-epimerase
MTSKRILITGLSTHWGGRLAQALEGDPAIEAIIGVDRRPPKVELQRTEFARVHDSHSLIGRIVEAAEIDTVVDTRMVVDSIVTTPRLAHENNVTGTTNVLAACSGAGNPVRKLVFKSGAHYYGAEREDPSFFTEDMERAQPPRTPIERDVVDADGAVRDFAAKNQHVTVTVLRFADGVGSSLRTSLSHLLGLPAIPAILGFDPRLQFIHEDDLAACLEHAVRHDIPGVYNAAADGVLVLSEIADLLGKPLAPVLPPWGTGFAAGVLRRARVRVAPETLGPLRYGRGLDNRALKTTGYRYRYTSREAVIKLREHQRVARVVGGGQDAYHYEGDLEEFLRRSPSVRPNARRAAPANLAPGERRETPASDVRYDDLGADELIALLPSLEAAALEELAAHEREHAARPDVLRAIAGLQGWEARR